MTTVLFSLRWVFLLLFIGVVAWLCWSSLKHDAS
jgi:cbb3-type cytochrome oxidase subunit 3